MNSKWYWLIRQKYRNLKFQIKKAAFRLNERKESSERLSSFSRIVIRTLLVQVAINLVLVAVLYVGDKLLLSAMEILAKTQTNPLVATLSESMTYQHGLFLKIHIFPPETQHFTAAQAVGQG